MSALFTLAIRLGNEEMQSPDNIAGVLRQLADDMDNGTAGDPYTPIELTDTMRISGIGRDINGNHVASWAITP